MSAELDQLRATFLDEAGEHLSALETGLLAVSDGAPDPEVLNGMFRAAHSLKGGSGLFELEAITRLTHATEQLLDRLRKGELLVTRALVDLLLRAVDGAGGLVAAARAGAVGAVPGALVSELNAAARVSPVASAVATGDTPLGPGRYRVTLSPGDSLLTEGPDPILLLRNLSRRGTVHSVVAALGSIPDLETLDATRSYLSWAVVVDTDQPQNALEDVFQFIGDDSSVTITPLRPRDPVPCAENGGAPANQQEMTEYETAFGQLLSWVATRLSTAIEHLQTRAAL
ncbi:MAG TPA: Hpt domain-containing protein [Gemmata sp.]